MRYNLDLEIPGAPNFKYREFVESEVAMRLGLENVPDSNSWQNITSLAIYVLQPIRDRFGRIKITSGFRSKEVNMAIGGSQYSNHCNGEAADIIPLERNVTLLEIISFVHSNLEYREMIYEWQRWIHVAYREGGNKRSLKIKDLKHNYQEVTLDYLFNYDRELRGIKEVKL